MKMELQMKLRAMSALAMNTPKIVANAKFQAANQIFKMQSQLERNIFNALKTKQSITRKCLGITVLDLLKWLQQHLHIVLLKDGK